MGSWSTSSPAASRGSTRSCRTRTCSVRCRHSPPSSSSTSTASRAPTRRASRPCRSRSPPCARSNYHWGVDRPIVSISPNNPVFDLPIYVARDEGLFEKAGIEVRYQAKYSQRNASDKEPFARLKESLFEQGKADVYNLCEWAGIDRSEHSARGAQVLALRPAVGAQAIISFDAALQEPRDLAGVPVGINDKTGSHYTTLQSLEGVLAREDIVVEHVGVPERRYEALKQGASRAVAVMEP